jgi:hypothetical protein
LFFEVGLVAPEKFNALFIAGGTAFGDGGVTFGDFGEPAAVSGFFGVDFPARCSSMDLRCSQVKTRMRLSRRAGGGGRGDGQFERAALDGFEASLVELDAFAVVKFLERGNRPTGFRFGVEIGRGWGPSRFRWLRLAAWDGLEGRFAFAGGVHRFVI